MARLSLLLSLCLVSLSFAACANGTSMPTSSKPLVSYNYTAVDALVRSAGKKINKDAPMLVGTIGDVNNVESSSTLGRAITEQISARLAQKGYKIAELKLRQGINIQQGNLDSDYTGEYLLSRDVRNISGEHKAATAVTGTYAVGRDNILVNLRLIDIRSGDLVTAYDYTLPKTRDINAMSTDTTTSRYSIFDSSDY